MDHKNLQMKSYLEYIKYYGILSVQFIQKIYEFSRA